MCCSTEYDWWQIFKTFTKKNNLCVVLLLTQHRLREVILGHTSAIPSINSSKRPCQTYLGNFHEYNVYVWRVGVYWNTCVKTKLFFFINPFFKKPLGDRGRGRRLPNPSHDCSLSRPSHTWTCHEFLWKRNAKKTGKKIWVSSLLFLPGSRVPSKRASRQESRIRSGLCNTLRHGLRPDQSE